jgi:hypothetical protein
MVITGFDGNISEVKKSFGGIVVFESTACVSQFCAVCLGTFDEL